MYGSWMTREELIGSIDSIHHHICSEVQIPNTDTCECLCEKQQLPLLFRN